MKLSNLIILFANEKNMKEMIEDCKNKIITNKEFFEWLNGMVCVFTNENEVNLVNGTSLKTKVIYIEKRNLKELLIEGKQKNIEFELMNDYSFYNLDDLEVDKFVDDFLKIYE